MSKDRKRELHEQRRQKEAEERQKKLDIIAEKLTHGNYRKKVRIYEDGILFWKVKLFIFLLIVAVCLTGTVVLFPKPGDFPIFSGDRFLFAVISVLFAAAGIVCTIYCLPFFNVIKNLKRELKSLNEEYERLKNGKDTE